MLIFVDAYTIMTMQRRGKDHCLGSTEVALQC